MQWFIALPVLAIILAVPLPALAHCPLCTIGAGAAAIGAKFFGAGAASTGVFLGAFAIALGSWTNLLLRKKQFFPRQKEVLEAVSFLGTILPLQPLFSEHAAIPIMLGGSYGSLLYRTYSLDMFLVGALVGGSVMYCSRSLSVLLSTLLKGKRIPYQGIILTFAVLVAASIILEKFL